MSWFESQTHQCPHEAFAQIEPVARVRAPKIVPWWIAT